MSTSPEGLHRTTQDAATDTTRDNNRNGAPTQTAPAQQAPAQSTPAQTTPAQTTVNRPAPDGRSTHDDPKVHENDEKRPTVLEQQKERFGGIKWGSAFFGWLTATGTAVILTALVTVAGGAFGLATSSGDAGQAAGQVGQAAQNPATAQTAGIVGAIVALVVLLIAYYCGGYVAGRMARFNGVKQGVAVWVWAVVVVILVAILAFVAGSQFDISAITAGLPQLPIDGNALSIGAIIAAVAAVVVALVGAILGGLAGMRFHRKIDRADFDR